MNRRDFFKSAAALAAVAGMTGKKALAQSKPKPGNNQIWLMTSAFPGDRDFEAVVARAKAVGAQGLEVCVFRRDSDRKDHVATHLDYETFDLDAAKRVVDICNSEGIRISVGSYDNLIGGDPAQQVNNQNHILKLIRIAALLGGDVNDVVCGTFVGYDHVLGRTDGGFEKNLMKYKKVFTPIVKYAESLGVTLCYENCPMEGWQPVTAPDCYNNLPGCLAARKLMYSLIPSRAHAETYDPSHDIWQHVDPVDVINAMDFSRLHRVHIKGTRNFPKGAAAVHWGRLFPMQSVSSGYSSFYVYGLEDRRPRQIDFKSTGRRTENVVRSRAEHDVLTAVTQIPKRRTIRISFEIRFVHRIYHTSCNTRGFSEFFKLVFSITERNEILTSRNQLGIIRDIRVYVTATARRI